MLSGSDVGMTAKDQTRKILSFLTWATRSERENTGEKWLGGEDGTFPESNSGSLLYTTTKAIKARHPWQGMPGPLRI